MSVGDVQNYTIGASRVGVGPMESSYKAADAICATRRIPTASLFILLIKFLPHLVHARPTFFYTFNSIRSRDDINLSLFPLIAHKSHVSYNFSTADCLLRDSHNHGLDSTRTRSIF